MYPSLGVRRMYLRVVRMTFGLSRPWPVYPNTTALYPVPVRRIRVAAFASFRSHLAVGTLARPCGSCHLGPRRTYTSWIHNMPGAPRKKPKSESIWALAAAGPGDGPRKSSEKTARLGKIREAWSAYPPPNRSTGGRWCRNPWGRKPGEGPCRFPWPVSRGLPFPRP